MSNSAGKLGESTSQVREHWYSFDFQDHARMHFLETPCSDVSYNSNGHNRADYGSGSEIHASRSHTSQGEAARTACDGQVRHEARDVASSPQRRLFDESIDAGESASRSPEIELKELERAWNLVRLEHSSMMASLAPKQLPQQHATNAGNTSCARGAYNYKMSTTRPRAYNCNDTPGAASSTDCSFVAQKSLTCSSLMR